MVEVANFDRLASSLSLDERKSLLDKLHSQSSISKDPLYRVDSTPDLAYNIGELYLHLPWYLRIWYFIMSIFKSKPPIKLYEERILLLYGKRIEAQSPGLYDYRKGMLLPLFYNQVQDLKTASRFFYTALDLGFNKDKGAFYAFLGSLVMPAIHTRLLDAAVPAGKDGYNAEVSEHDIRTAALKSMDESLKAITEEQRAAMYIDARFLYCLKELSSFLFDRLILSFTYVTSLKGYTCTVGVVKEMLSSLNNILFSLRDLPSMPLLGSLFVFVLQEREHHTGSDIDKEIHGLLIKAEEALGVIRKFNQQVPLTKILRCAGRNSPVQEISGGEDWFIVYRDYWKRHIEDNVANYLRDHRKEGLLASFSDFLKGKELEPIANTVSDTNPDGFPLKGAFGLSFLLAFYSAVFIKDVNKTLNGVLVDGEFAKKENRTEFNECFNGLIQIKDKIHSLERQISPTGDYEKRLIVAQQDMSSLQVRRRRIQIVIDEASTEALGILQEARKSCQGLINVLKGITEQDPSGKYLSLSNLSEFTGKDGKFIKSLNDEIQKLQTTLDILDNIETMEAGR
jgi:hypothetical protein